MRRSLLALVVALALLGTAVAVALATPGEFDTTFDGDGIRTLDVTSSDFGRDVLVQPDGRIAFAGSAGADGLVARLRADGEPDTDFNDLGHKVLPGAGAGQGVARAPNGDLIVAGTVLAGAAYNITVMRIRPNGTPDTGFGTAGLKTVDFGGSETATDVLVQPDGKIVVAGYTDTDELVVRLNANGTPDTSFDGDGKVALEFGAAAYGNAVALAPDGKIVVAGYVYDADDPDLTVARLLANGTPDPSFDGDGLKRIDPGTLDYGWDVLVQPDGKLLVTGASDSQFLTVRLTGSGALDQGFDGDGVAKANPGGAAASLGAALQANGKIVLAGQVVAGMGPQQAAVVRLQPGGTLDSTFSFDGVQRVNLPSSTAEAVALQTDGHIVLAGTTTAAGNVDAWVARLEGDPPSIGGGPAPGQPGSPSGGGSGGGGPGGRGRGAKVPRCAGKKATIVGTNRADKLKGTRRNDVIVALGGNDKIDGARGNDVICAGDGNDTTKGGAGNDHLYGQNGKDTEAGGPGNDQLDGGSGKDALAGGSGDDHLDGGSGDDRLTGDSGKDALAGGSGKDRLTGGGGRDSCNGGAGKDRAACERERS
jgi:uncharacterized delta-60 repeat protein